MVALQTELAELSAVVKTESINKLIDPALADGRLKPGQKDWALALGESNLESLSAYLETAQPIAALAGTQTGGIAPEETHLPAYRPVHGYSVDSEQEALHAKILAHAQANNIPYETAALAVGA
jgi:phage I-like protein